MSLQLSGIAINQGIRGDGSPEEPYGRLCTYHTKDNIPEIFSKDYFAEAVEKQILRHGDVVIVIGGIDGNVQTDTAVIRVDYRTSSHRAVFLTGSAFMRMSRKIRLFWEKAAEFF